MTKILLPICNGELDLWLFLHGLKVAERCLGSMYVLNVSSDSNVSFGQSLYQNKIKKMLNTKSKEVQNVYCNVVGEFKSEVVNFVLKEGIDLVILGFDYLEDVNILNLAKELRYKYDCKVEIIKKTKRRSG
ncbi:MAG: hypothetical protein Q9M37_01970 [Desulfonauticus sp.]|nr:hypothetical protein [Desulfonauticus sp.]